MKKRIKLTVMTIVIIGVLIGCSKNTMNQIYNDDTKIASKYDTFGIDESKETIESGVYKGEIKLSGSGTIWTYESSSDMELDVPYALAVKNGKAKIVLISPNDTVTKLVENTDKITTEGKTSLVVPIKKGSNRIKVVASGKAEIAVELHIKDGTFTKIDF